ncbi:unnamed protein product [Schistosoma turkestanicum]|nr:unnamed protein product [Schistosoma turkestanicum]
MNQSRLPSFPLCDDQKTIHLLNNFNNLLTTDQQYIEQHIDALNLFKNIESHSKPLYHPINDNNTIDVLVDTDHGNYGYGCVKQQQQQPLTIDKTNSLELNKPTFMLSRLLDKIGNNTENHVHITEPMTMSTTSTTVNNTMNTLI